VVTRRGRGRYCAPAALDRALLGGPSTSPLEVPLAFLPDDNAQLSDDPGHPIPFVFNCDIQGVKKTGGSGLVVIIASPLQDDERSLNRLMKKIQMYIRFISSAEFQTKSGPPTVENTRIKVSIHPKSAPKARELLFQCHDWVRSNNATLEVDDQLPHLKGGTSNNRWRGP
jgi:hypothetical protein